MRFFDIFNRSRVGISPYQVTRMKSPTAGTNKHHNVTPSQQQNTSGQRRHRRMLAAAEERARKEWEFSEQTLKAENNELD